MDNDGPTYQATEIYTNTYVVLKTYIHGSTIYKQYLIKHV